MKIGFVIPTAEIKIWDRNLRYGEMRDLALRAEESNFDSIWLVDHLLYRMNGRPTNGVWECWTLVSALAEATKKVELGTLVLCSPLRNPAVLAKMAHAIDEVSAGRFILGIGAGWNKPEFDAFGIPFDHLTDRFEEALQILHPLLKQGYVDFAGKYYQAPNCEAKPLSPRAGGPPLMIGSGTGPRMMKLSAKYADIWNTPYTGAPETLDEPCAKLQAALAQEDKAPNAVRFTVLVALNYPDLAERPQGFDNLLSGSTEELAHTMKEYEKRNVTHMIFQFAPYHPESLERLVQSVTLYRNMS